MLTWILLIIMLALFTVLFTWLFGRLFGRGEILPPTEDPGRLINRNRERLAAGEIDAVEFDIVPRGYRPDQVDALLEELKSQLSETKQDIIVTSSEKSD